MSITVRKKKGKNGISLYLDTCHKGTRSYEFLDIILRSGTSPADREHNKEMMNLAERIKLKRWDEILNQNHGLPVRKKVRVNFLAYAYGLITERKGFNRGHSAVLNAMERYAGKGTLYAEEITERFLNNFYDYMESYLTGETPSCYFKKLKRLFREATKEKIFATNPAAEIRCRKFQSKEKDTLTFDEIRRLVDAKCPNEAVKSGFLFSCLTGLRYSDVKALTGASIKGDMLEIVQIKTKVKVCVMLNEDARKLIPKNIPDGQLVFRLPSHTSCLKSLRRWMLNANIDKHICWHNSRHSLAANLILNGTDIYTTSKCLGHKSLRHTERYVRESIKLKQEAVNNLPKIF